MNISSSRTWGGHRRCQAAGEMQAEYLALNMISIIKEGRTENQENEGQISFTDSQKDIGIFL